MPQKQVPVLITWDVDPDDYIDYETRQNSLDLAMTLCEGLNIPATFFVTANSSHVTEAYLQRLLDGGHEVGCHGLTHKLEENYDQMPVEMQRRYIEEATEKLTARLGQPLYSFRSPRVKTSAATLKLLAEYGYAADSTVCSQRIDFISSNLINFGWLTAPRKPYQPHKDNVFKQGDVPIWEVPVSAIVLPYISSTTKVFGLSMMKFLFKLLYAESKRTGKPIVYLAHPTEFIKAPPPRFRLKHLSPSFIRAHGFFARRFFYRHNVGPASTAELFKYMASFSDVSFMTLNQYTTQYLGVNERQITANLTLDEGNAQ